MSGRLSTEKRWVPHRVGLVNYWYYDEEEFHFAGGKLLLRGSNGSGKSVTMQSLIPLLLDGNKSPERLDPFGSRARQMQDYLLGDEDRRVDQRTGYLFMEFKREQQEQYVTIGIGLQARRYQPVDSWGFAITDGRRVGHDLRLYKPGLLQDNQIAKVPISKRELKELLGEGGVLCTTQGEYMALVNQLIFGFDSLEEYDELIKLLIHLRSPKLSKDFRPSVLYDIMNSSLQALSDEDLRPLTETIENMDQMRTQLEQLKRNRQAALKVGTEYDKYNRAVLYNKAMAWKDAARDLGDNKNEVQHKEAQLGNERRETAQLGLEITRLEQEREALQVKERELRDDDAFQLEEKYQSELKRQDKLDQEIRSKQNSLSQKVSREKEIEKQAREVEFQGERLEERLAETLEEMDVQADGAHFEDHAFNQADLKAVWGDFLDFGPWQRDTRHYQERVKAGRTALEEEHRAVRRYDELLHEQDKYEKEKEQAARRQEASYQTLDQARQQFLNTLAEWYEQNEELRLKQEERYPFHQLILDYGEGKNKGDLEKYLFPIFSRLDQVLASHVLEKQQEAKNLKETESQIAEELQEWRGKPDPQPERDPQVTATRRLLGEAGIPCLPFYETIDFREGVTPEARGVLEAVFMDMGILDALIVPTRELARAKAILGQGADKLLVASASKQQTMPNLNLALQVVCPHENLFSHAQQILSSMSLRQDGSQWFVGQDGSFSLGPVVGRSRQGIPSRFIGAESRRRYRQEKITELEEKLRLLQNELGEVQREIRLLEASRERLSWEFSNLPGTGPLDLAVSEWNGATRDVLLKTERLERQISLVQAQFAVVQEQKSALREKTKGFSLPLSLAKFQQAQEEMQRYEVMLARFEGQYQQWLSAKERSRALQANLEELQEDVDYLKGELNIAERELQGCTRMIGELQSLREREDYRKLQEEIAMIIARLRDIPEEIKDKATRKGHLEGHLLTLSKQLEFDRERSLVCDQHLKQAEVELKAELRLGFVILVPRHFEEDWAAQATGEIFNLATASFDETLLTRRLQEAVYEQRTDLLDYGLSIGEAATEGAEAGRRLEVTARLEGRVVTLYQLSKWIEQEIANNESLLDEADRELFEEIIMQTVGQKIRAKIYRAEEWVRNMNRLMAERDTTSGLTLHLQWKPKPAETEDELGTRELVDILKTDVSILSEEIFNQVTMHFRSQVQRAKTRLEEQDFRQSFHQTIQSVLDYRKWFEFKLFFQKTGETRRELTNRAFDRLSGGEKAMAMYIPLFSSVYSRYQAARPDSPRLISLDEAFAGVDDSNIRDMFQLMEHLGFDYIINSQILWGDYDTVSQLSICELVRPKNADYVTVIRYLWNGKYRSLLADGLAEAASGWEG